ncbi:MAG: bifunctional nuclease family protein [Chlamydiia bacterium]|nr:bifunctional nuclease family protein [Chlamydiia bacterium]
MTKELIQLSFDKIMQTRNYTVVILAAREKRFAIYTEPSIGKVLQLFLTGVQKSRPLTFDLITSIFDGYNIQVKQVVINDLVDTTYYARLFLEQDEGDLKHVVEIDARPSDCISIALMNNVPVFCTRDVLDRTIHIED